MPRPRLLQALGAAPTRLLVLRAGPGYGKRVLATQWAGHGPGARWAELLPGADGLEQAAAGLIRAARATSRLVIVGYRAGEIALDDVLESLLDGGTERRPILLLVADRPPPALERWRLAEQVLVLTATDLAFDPEEAAALLRGYEADTNEANLDAVMERSRGWPVAVRAAAELAASGVPCQHLCGDGPPFAEYLAAEVWRPLTPAEREVAQAVAVLDDADPALVQQVCESPGAATFLRRLRERASWLLPPSPSDRAVRPNPLVREFMLARLDEEPARRRAVELRAAGATAGRARFLDAAAHALTAGDWERACAHVRRGADRAFREGRPDRLRACLERFPREWRYRAELQRIEGYLAWAAGDLPLALARAERAATATGPDLRAEALTLAAAVRYATGDMAGEHQALRSALEAGARDHDVLGKVHYALASLHYRAGDLVAAEAELARAAEQARDDGALARAIQGFQPLLQLANGKPRAAAEGLRAALLAARAAGNRRGEAHAAYHLALALGQAGRHERALDTLSEARRLASELGLAHLAALVARETADALRDLGSPGAPAAYRAALAQLERLEASSGMLHAHHGLAVLRRRQGDIEGARRAASAAIAYANSGEPGFVALVRLHQALVEGRRAAAEPVLTEVLARPQRYHHALALLYAAALGGDRASVRAEEARALVRHEGFEHLLAEEAELLAALPDSDASAPGAMSRARGEPAADDRPRVLLILLGGLEVRLAGGGTLPLRRQARELLAHLALVRGSTIDGSRIVETLWPGRDREMRRALQTLVWLLRRELGRAVVATRDKGYAFDPQEEVWVDVEAFTAALREGDAEQAVALYKGELLPGVEWAELDRRHLEQRYLDALERLATERLAQGRFQEGISLLERIVALDPLAEESYARLIACHEAVGRHDVARRWSQEFHRQLEREIGAAVR